MRRTLDLIYDAAGYLAAFFVFAIFAVMIGSTVMRELGLRTLGEVLALPRDGLRQRFGPVLLRELDRARPLPPPVPFVQVVGPTDSHLRIVVDSSGGVLGLTERGGRSYVAFSSPMRALNPAAHQLMFEEYRRSFQRWVGPATR